ncbi:MAG: tetratricopeptide repeat protein [Polyangiales bacterium]
MKRLIEAFAGGAAGALILLTAVSASAQAKKPDDKGKDKEKDKPAAIASPGNASNSGGGWMKAGAGECISSEAKKVLAACPAGSLSKSSGKKGGANFIETDTNQPGKEKKKPDAPTSKDLTAGRPSPELSGKIKTALMTEIVALETQYAKIKVTSDKHVLIARRLAESYYELERIEQAEVLDLTTKILLGAKKNDPAVPKMKEDKGKAEALRDKSQDRVVFLYRQIVDKHEDYSKLDEVLYYLAYEYEQRKATDPNDKAQIKMERENKEKALATYLELIKKRPKSKFVSAAYIAYGDLYFEDALNGKIDWKIPLEAYDRVIASGEPPDNKQWGYAQYKKGFIYWNLGQYKDAVTAFKKAIEFGTKFSDLPKAPQIAEEARKELVPVYAEYGKADEAYGFFSPISGDKPGDKTKTIALLEKLGEEYLGRAHPMEAKGLYTQLKGHNPSNACFYDTRITEAVINNSPKDKPAIRAQLAMLTKGFVTYRDSAAPEEKKKSCGNQTAWLLSEHAIAWEYEALGDLGCPPDPEKKAANPKARPGTCNKDTIASSIDVFELILKNFKTFEGYKFNVKNPEDAPTVPKMKYSYADLLYGQGFWEKCGPAFDEVVAMDPNGPVAGDAAFAAVLCYQNVYDKQYKGADTKEATGKGKIDTKKVADDGLKTANTPKEMTGYQSKMIGAFDRFVCYVKPDSASKTYKEDLDKLVEIKYRRGFIYYDAKHWDEAAEAFRDVAVTYPDHEYGVIAAGFYLDSVVRVYNYAEPARANCGVVMSDDVGKLVDLYCDNAKVTARLKDKKKADEFLNGTASQCDKLHAAKADLDAIKADDLAKAGKTEEAADKFVMLADEICSGNVAKSDLDKKATEAAAAKKPKKPGKPGAKEPEVESSPCEDRADVYLYNAASNYQKASKIKKAMDIREKKILAHESWKTKETYRLTMFDLAEDYRRIALYSTAAKWYEIFAATDPSIPKLLELAPGKIEKERADHPEKYKDKKIEDVAKEDTEEQRASALSNAVILRLGLGMEEEAIRDSETFEKRFGTKRKDQARQIFLAIGEHYVEKEEWKKGADRLDKFIKQFEKDARLDERLHARALAGRAYYNLKQNGPAEKLFGEIRGDWKASRDKLRETIEKDAKDNPTLSKIRQNAYSAVAEAYLFFADKEAVKAEAVKFEAYKGNGETENYNKYFKDKFAPYLKKRLEANEPAYAAYVRVFCLGEGTTPDKGCTREWKDVGEAFASKFVVEAASKAGDLYADTYDKARSAPLSNDLLDQPSDSKEVKKQKEATRFLYYSVFDRTAEPIKQPARTAFMECLFISTQAKFFDDYSERCEKWLAKVYKSEFRTLEEVRPSPGLVGTGLKDRAFLVDSKLVPFDVAVRK